jgi:hypothetical protein
MYISQDIAPILGYCFNEDKMNIVEVLEEFRKISNEIEEIESQQSGFTIKKQILVQEKDKLMEYLRENFPNFYQSIGSHYYDNL